LTEGVLRRELLRWYRRHRRDLPWRRTNDPYAIWVSEVMLQQTTAAAVAPRWAAFLRRFPTVGALARSPEREVLAAWAGLGYYARARSLRKGARAILSAGAFPRTADGWRVLPGVGPYTAAAVASICFGEPAAVLDGNVARVLSRLGALRLDPRSAAGARCLRSVAQALLDPSAPGDFNQALMELGATVCTPRAPRCAACPLRASCKARSLGTPEAFPTARESQAAARTIHLAAGVAFRGRRLVLVKDRELVPGHLTVPLFRVPAGERPEDVLRREWQDIAGLKAVGLEPLGRLRHSVLDRRYRVDVFALEEKAPTLPPRRPTEKRWGARSASPRHLRLLRESDLSGQPHGGLTVKLLRLLAVPGRARPRPQGKAPRGR
jgi:A/G-specific adenine glycosylase